MADILELTPDGKRVIAMVLAAYLCEGCEESDLEEFFINEMTQKFLSDEEFFKKEFLGHFEELQEYFATMKEQIEKKEN